MKEESDILIVEAIEKYLNGEMGPEELSYFEQLKAATPRIGQLLAEHELFMSQIGEYGNKQNFRAGLTNIHTSLLQAGDIQNRQPTRQAKVIYLWNKYKKVAIIAACTAGITATVMSGIFWSFSPTSNNKKIQALSREFENIKKAQRQTHEVVKNIEHNIGKSIDPNIVYKTGGSGFVIDKNGILITNYHVIKAAKYVAVQNAEGKAFNAKVIYSNPALDIALLKIEDDEFKPFASIPFGIKQSAASLAEPIFTLGFPRDEIVYDQGYLSAKTGFNGDTLTCQLTIPANPGNSGGPVINQKGEVIGLISSRELVMNSVVFAIKSNFIYDAVSELKADSVYKNFKINSKSSIAGLDRQAQVKKLEDYIFMVKIN